MMLVVEEAVVELAPRVMPTPVVGACSVGAGGAATAEVVDEEIVDAVVRDEIVGTPVVATADDVDPLATSIMLGSTPGKVRSAPARRSSIESRLTDQKPKGIRVEAAAHRPARSVRIMNESCVAAGGRRSVRGRQTGVGKVATIVALREVVAADGDVVVSGDRDGVSEVAGVGVGRDESVVRDRAAMRVFLAVVVAAANRSESADEPTACELVIVPAPSHRPHSYADLDHRRLSKKRCARGVSEARRAARRAALLPVTVTPVKSPFQGA